MVVRCLVAATISALVACASAGRVTHGASDRGGFVATLGNDTVHIERFQRSGYSLSGTIVTRVPATRVIHWSMTLDGRGRPARYTVETTRPDGTPTRANWSAGSMTFSGDSIVRETLRNGAPETQRLAAAKATYPAPLLPYIGVSFLMHELAFREARSRAATDGDSSVYSVSMMGSQSRPQRARVWLVAADSAELDYFGVTRSGYRFDPAGRLLRADWTLTTYRYRIARVPEVDVVALARRWADAERAGGAFGALSPRDTARGSTGSAQLVVDYSRPAKRGRVVWGDVVPWGRVWRLGADMATHLSTSADIVIGTTPVPAGRYTLWMLPSPDSAMLVVNRQVNIFGTNYNAAQDLTRIPLSRQRTGAPVERLTITPTETALLIAWDDVVWSVPIRAR